MCACLCASACASSSSLHTQRLALGGAPLGGAAKLAWPRNCSRPSGRHPAPAPAALGRGQPADHGEEASTSGHSHLWRSTATAARAAAVAAAVLLPACAAQAAEAAPEGFLEFIIQHIDALGPWGPAAFVATVAIAECIPLFPTQPLSLASGLLFGAQKGALCVLSGSTLAAVLAFLIARGIGRPLAERVIKHEMSGDSSEQGVVAKKLAELQHTIEQGSFWQQAGAVLLLRMTPLLPFSASNYVLGLSPMPLPPYLAGTAVGMTFWSILYASLGGASRTLLRRGVDPDVLLADLMDKAGSYTRELAVAGAVAGGVVLLYVGAKVVRGQLAGATAGEGDMNAVVAASHEEAGKEAADGRKEAVNK